MPDSNVTSATAEVESFVLGAVRSWATSAPTPTAPRNDEWIRTAGSAGVLATVGDALVLGRQDAPLEVRTARLLAAATSMRVMSELNAVAEALADVRWAVLKGPVLADVVYRRKASRTYDDLDVLVHPADLPRTLDALDANGFTLIDRNWPMIDRMQRGEISLATPGGMNLDLHWHPINDASTRAQLAVDVDLLLQNAVDVDVNGRSLPSLAPADLVVYVAMHGCLSGGHLLRWLLDLQQAAQWSGCTPRQLATSAERHGLALVLRVMLDRASTYVDDSLTPFVEAAARASLWSRGARAVSLREPPTPGAAAHRRTGRSVFAATRTTSAESARQLVTDLVRDFREQRSHAPSPNSVAELHAEHDSSSSRASWLAAAKAYRP